MATSGNIKVRNMSLVAGYIGRTTSLSKFIRTNDRAADVGA